MKNWTPDEKLLFSAFLSILGSTTTGACSAAYQQWSTGAINPGIALNVALIAFITLLGRSLYDYVPAHITQELQALRDLQAQLFAHPPTIPDAPQQPLVVIHTTGATTQDEASEARNQAAVQPAQIARTNPAGMSTVAVPRPSDDLLGDLPATSGVAPAVTQITGNIPTYGASGK